MRTTVEITPEQRARLLELAARQGRKGFSHLVREALETYLARQQRLSSTVRDRLSGRATLDIDETLQERLKQVAAARGLTIPEVIEELLGQGGPTGPGSRPRFRLRWEPVSGHLLPGIDLDDRDALIERMENRS